MLDYETALTVAAVTSEDAFLSAQDMHLRPEAFTDDLAFKVWDALCENFSNGVKHSKVELSMKIKEKYPEDAGAIDGWLSLARAETGDISAHKQWLEHVAKAWTARRKQDAVKEAVNMAAEGASASEIATYLSEKEAEIEDSTRLEEHRLEQQRKSVLEHARQRIQGTGSVVKTGIHVIDRDMGKLMGHEFVVLAARPGCGKSSLAREIMTGHIKAEKKPVMLFSLEMTTDQVVQALASSNCGVSSFRIEDDFEPRQERLIAEVERWTNALGTFLHVRDDCYSIRDIEHAIGMAMRRHKPSIIFIDYLQLVSPPQDGQKRNREQEVAYMSRRFKQLAQMHRVPIVCLAQLSRGMEKDQREPRLDDLRESGSLEQDADRVWFLYHEKDKEMVDGLTPIKFIQAKCRGGETLDMPIGFKKPITKFIFEKPTEPAGTLI